MTNYLNYRRLRHTDWLIVVYEYVHVCSSSVLFHDDCMRSCQRLGFYFLHMCTLSTGAPVCHSTEPTDRDVIYLSDVIYRDKGVQTTRGRHMSE